MVQETYAAVDTLRADFTSGADPQGKRRGGKAFRRAGVQKPLLVRWETKTPAPELLVVGKKEIWNVFVDEQTAYKYPLSLAEDSRSIVRVITGQALLTQNYDVEPKGTEDGLLRLNIYPHEPTQKHTAI